MGGVKFVIDRAKLLNLGGGSVAEFCKRYDIDRQLFYSVIGRSRVSSGTQAHKIVEKLIEMGVGKFVNVDEAESGEKETA
ncbi:hypothetical protein [Hydrogenimonas sp.]